MKNRRLTAAPTRVAAVCALVFMIGASAPAARDPLPHAHTRPGTIAAQGAASPPPSASTGTSKGIMLIPGWPQEANLAVLAALLALIFGVVRTAFENTVGYMVGRKRKHHYAAVRFELAVSQAMTRLDLNVQFMKEIRKAIGEKRPISGFPAPFAIDETHLLDLYNLDVMNDVIDLDTRLHSFNHTLDSLEAFYLPLRAGYMSDQISDDRYHANAQQLSNQFGELIGMLEEVRIQCVAVLEKLRILGYRDRPFRTFGWLMGWYLRSEKVTSEEIARTRKRVADAVAARNK